MAHLLAAMASTVVLQFGVLPGFSQSYLFTGAETTITLNPGTYDITAFGAQGGSGNVWPFSGGGPGLGAEMEAEFNITTATTLTLLVGGAGSNNGAGGGGGGGSFVVNGSTPLLVASGGGGGCGT
ncbi:MAG: glycine-rich protein [Verrucomicrobiota bacterium]